MFNPVASGSLHFKIRTPYDAHIALTSRPFTSDPMYEIIIGGLANQKSAIRRNRQKPEKATANTPDVLSNAEYRGFWIRWSGGYIAVGREGEVAPFVSWDDPDPFGIGYYGLYTGWEAKGYWLVEGVNNYTTDDQLAYLFRPIPMGLLHVEVRAPSYAHIALTLANNVTEPMYEIFLGGWFNSASSIRYNRQQPDKVKVETPELLTDDKFMKFVVEWHYGLITVKKDGELLMVWKDPNPIGISHFGVRTPLAKGHWKIGAKDPRVAIPTTAPTTPTTPPPLGAACWVDVQGGKMPPGAVPGGFDNKMYVGRARHNGALIPGKIVPSRDMCYIPWRGQEHGKKKYQVLAGCEVAWIPVVGGELPRDALPAGESETGEHLFVCRAKHKGTRNIGKVEASHSKCYIPYKGQEITYQQYEVLVLK